MLKRSGVLSFLLQQLVVCILILLDQFYCLFVGGFQTSGVNKNVAVDS